MSDPEKDPDTRGTRIVFCGLCTKGCCLYNDWCHKPLRCQLSAPWVYLSVCLDTCVCVCVCVRASVSVCGKIYNCFCQNIKPISLVHGLPLADG